MSESSSPAPLPPSGGASNNPITPPDLSVVPNPSPRQVGLTRRQMEAISLTIAILDVARKPGYTPRLAQKLIDETFFVNLELDVARLLGFGRTAVDSVATGKDATQSEGSAEATLLATLREIQSAARLQHLPNHPQMLEKYYIGHDISASRAVLEAISQNMITQANEERPGEIDTGFIERAKVERKAYVDPNAAQRTALGQGKQARAQRDEQFAIMVASRKKIQYAADVLWPCKKSDCQQARSDFRLPAKRPYTY